MSETLTWVECFNSYTAVLTTFFPSRSRDLLAYMALVIRTAKRFGGKAWLEYDRAFRREAAASSLRDWSLMRPDLYNYHTALANRTVAISNDADQSSQRSFREEPRGEASAKQFCISWNKGTCSSAYQFCRFRHNCSFPECNGPPRVTRKAGTRKAGICKTRKEKSRNL